MKFRKNMAFTLNFSDFMFIIKVRDFINQSATRISALLFSFGGKTDDFIDTKKVLFGEKNLSFIYQVHVEEN